MPRHAKILITEVPSSSKWKPYEGKLIVLVDKKLLLPTTHDYWKYDADHMKVYACLDPKFPYHHVYIAAFKFKPADHLTRKRQSGNIDFTLLDGSQERF